MYTEPVNNTMQTSEDLLSVKFKEELVVERRNSRNSKNSKNNTPVRKSKTHLKLPKLEKFTEAAKRRQSLAVETV